MDAATEAQPIQCANPDCQVASSGRCVEGIEDLKSCLHFGKTVLIREDYPLAITKVQGRSIRMPNAEALSTPAAQAIIRNQSCVVVSIIGPHDSGKTSLIGGIYDMLQRGPVGGYAFAGSTTLHAFERACHDSRTASNRDDPHMERTPTGDATYFHLDLFKEGGLSKCATLFANRAGEDYMDTHSDPYLANSFSELRRSDTLTLLADGAKLVSKVDRHLVKDEICQSIRAFIEAGETRKWQRLAVVLTKVDAVRKQEDLCQRALDDFKRIVSDVQEQFSAEFIEIQAFQVAASPKISTAERGEGMVDLLAFWMTAPGRKYDKIDLVTVTPERSFGRLRLSKPGESNGK